MFGGYEEGYQACPCFWGREPGSLIKLLNNFVKDYKNLEVLDLGCGEGKNSVYFSKLGAKVRAIDVSKKAIENAKQEWPKENTIIWEIADIREVKFSEREIDIIICYGLFHCFKSKIDIEEIVKRLKAITRKGGYFILCSFNNRFQDLSAHPGFEPILLSHDWYLGLFSDFEILVSTDSDLEETHPHNNLKHKHSLTRLIARKLV